MAINVTVRNGGAVGSGTVDLTGRFRFDEEWRFGNRAFMGEAAQSSFVIDDDDGEYGNSEDLPGGLTALSVAAHNVVTVTETATTPATTLVRGRVIPKEIGRADLDYSRGRQLTVRLDDYNADLKGIVLLTEQARGSETDVARVTWVFDTYLSGSPRLTTDLTNGIVNANTVTMPAKTYPVGTPILEILGDCAIAAEKTFFVMADGTFYYASHDDTSQVAGLRISDRDDEINLDTTAAAQFRDGGGGGSADGPAPVIHLTVPTGLTNGALIIMVGKALNGGNWPPDTVTWEPIGETAQEATYVDSVSHGTQGGIAIYYVTNPTPGPGAIRHTSTSIGAPVGGWVFENVDQTTPIADYAFATGTGTSASASMTLPTDTVAVAAVTVDDDDFSLDSVAAPTTGAGMTEDWTTAAQLGTPGYRDQESAGGHGDASPSWTLDESHPWSAFVAAVNGATPTVPPIWTGPASVEDGQGLLSGGVLRYDGDTVVTETRSSVADLYDYWVETINDVGAVGPTDAASRLSAILNLRQYEERTYAVAVQLRRSQVNLVMAGQMIDIKARAIPDADDQYRTRRIASLEWQPFGTEYYWAIMELDRPANTRGAGAAGGIGGGQIGSEALVKAQAAITHINATSDAHDAAEITVTDAGGYYAGTDVEAVLQELGSATGGVPTGYYRPVMDGLGNVVTDSGTGAALMAFAED